MTVPAAGTAVTPRRGEIYWLDFNPATGMEMRDPHPALVVQNDVANQVSGVTIVAALTSNLRVADLPVGVRVDPQESGLPRASAVHLGHVYTVDKRRLQRRVGVLTPETMQRVEQALLVSFGFSPFRIARRSSSPASFPTR
jgi:mRNA interferase MazF